MEERLRFVARVLDGEAMTDMCREFGISRKTGYKIFGRYKEHGLEALTDRSRRPVRYANQLPEPIESLIVRLKREKPYWGARKIRELLVRRLDGDIRIPAKSTIHAVLDRHQLVKRGGGPRHRARGTPLSAGAAPNDLWCADFNGEFNGRYVKYATSPSACSVQRVDALGDLMGRSICRHVQHWFCRAAGHLARMNWAPQRSFMKSPTLRLS